MGHAATSHRGDRALCRRPPQRALRAQTLMDQLKHLIDVWTSYAQGLTGSIGALAFVCAFIWKMVAHDLGRIARIGPRGDRGHREVSDASHERSAAGSQGSSGTITVGPPSLVNT